MGDKIETSLAMTYAIIKRRVGRVLGLPDDESNWTQKQAEAVDSVIEDGLRQYYQPPTVDEFGAHQWSFMYPILTMKTVSGQRWYPMPDGFTGEITDAGGITYSGDNKTYTPIRITSDSHLRRLGNTDPDTNSYPRYAAVTAKNDRGITPQEWELGFHPTPDATYEFQYQSHIEPYMLTDDRPYPLGGQGHAQGILYSCLASAEMFEFDRRGEHYNAFVTQLKADIQKDARRAPATLGRGHPGGSGWSSSSRGWGRSSIQSNSVTYNNTSWD